jgi:hypothetical protein
VRRAISFGLSGIVVVAIGRLAAKGRLPRNLFAGIRIPSTMRSDEAWRAGHEAAASALTAAGIGPIAAAVIVATRGPSRDTQSLLFRVGNGWLLAWLGLATVQASGAGEPSRAVPA